LHIPQLCGNNESCETLFFDKTRPDFPVSEFPSANQAQSSLAALGPNGWVLVDPQSILFILFILSEPLPFPAFPG
jgi:hypothetical protein